MPAPQAPPATTPAAAPAPTLAQQTAALAKESVGSAADWTEPPDSAAAPRESIASVNAAKAAPAPADESDDGDDGEDPPEGTDPAATPAAATAGLPPELAALVQARDLDALAAHLGIADAAEYFGIKADDFKAIRHERKKISADKAELTTLRGELQEKYGDPITARRLFHAGDLNAFFDTVEKWSGVPYVDVQKAWALHVQGKAAPKLVPKAPEAVTATADAAKVAQLKERITGDIASDPLAKRPGIVDLVFEKMRAGWNKGVRTPAAALKLVAADLVEQNKADRAALRKAGLIKGKAPPAEAEPAARVTVTPRRGSATTQATTGKPGNSRPMTDKELAQDVLRGLGKEVWRP